jgi:DNA-binding beta-propeller fold protein YncE
MTIKPTLLIASAVAAVAAVGTANASDLKQIGQIAIPGEPLTSFDIGFVDQKTHRYLLADRSNKAVDIFDTNTDTYIGRVDGFVGIVKKGDKVVNSQSGPDGVLTFGGEAWVGDGDSTIKVIDLKTMKITATLNTGGKTRLDEMAYDPKDQIFIGVNNAEEPPFATLISTKPDHKIVAKVTFPDAKDGAEQPAYNPSDGHFYVAIPQLGQDEKKGGVAVIEPMTGKLLRTLAVDNCKPNGLAFGPDQNFLLGCQANGKKVGAPILVVMNAQTGKVVANISDIGGADMVAYSARNGQYYSGSSNFQPSPVLGVIDATTNKLVQKVPITGGSPHSVAVDDTNGHVFLPVGTPNGGCGCIQVFAPSTPSTTGSSAK